MIHIKEQIMKKTFIAKVEVLHTYEAVENFEYIINAKSAEDAKKDAKSRAYDECDQDMYSNDADHRSTYIDNIDVSAYVNNSAPSMRCKHTIDMFLG